MSKHEETPISVPAYIVTYSDMITLLLTFFVLLISLAQNQDDDQFKKVQKSFRNALADFGVHRMFPKMDTALNFPESPVPNNIDIGNDNPESRSIDPERESKRRLFLELGKMMKVSSVPTAFRMVNMAVTDIRFEPGKSDLNDQAKHFLSSYCRQVAEHSSNEKAIIYVIGLAAEEHDAKEQFKLSALRAQTAADFLKDNLKELKKVSVLSWGAGTGGNWTNEEEGIIQQNTDITIVELAESGG